VVQLTFDPKQVSFKEILEVFFVIHDPTTLDRQGNDVGTQYRSAIFHHSAEQKAAAEQVIRNVGAAKIYDDPIVTEVVAGLKVLRGRGLPSGILPAQSRAALLRLHRQAESRKFRKHFLEKLKK